MPCRPLSALREKAFSMVFDFGMYHRQFALEEGWAAENQVFAPHFDPFFDPFDSLEPDQFGHAAAVVHDGRETSFAPCSGIADACDAPRNWMSAESPSAIWSMR